MRKKSLFLLLVILFILGIAYQNADRDNFGFSPPVTGQVPGMANIHGIETDHSFDPPSTNPDDWEILNDGNPIVHHSQTIGGRKIDPVGFYLTQNNLALFYNNAWSEYDKYFEIYGERGYSGSRTQAGSLMAFDEDWNLRDYYDNPVFDEPQRAWQGRDRTNPYALVWHPDHEVFYLFYGDFAEGGDNDKYPGRRALGVAKSKDIINWEYLTKNRPLFHILDMVDFSPETFSGISDVTRQGRVYAFGATFHDGYIYLQVGGSTNRELDYVFTIRSQDPMNGWEYVRSPQHRPMPFYFARKWYTVRNIRDPNDPEKRAIGLVHGDTLDDLDHEPDYLFSTGFSSSAGVSRQLFMYQGRWYIAFRQSDEEDYRSMYIAKQK